MLQKNNDLTNKQQQQQNCESYAKCFLVFFARIEKVLNILPQQFITCLLLFFVVFLCFVFSLPLPHLYSDWKHLT